MTLAGVFREPDPGYSPLGESNGRQALDHTIARGTGANASFADEPAVGLTVRTESSGGHQPVTIIEGDVDGDDVVVILADMIRDLSHGQQMELDVSKIRGLTDAQRNVLRASVGSDVRVVGATD